MTLKQTHVMMPDALVTAAKSIAVAEDVSMSEIVRRALRDYVARLANAAEE